jgi:hypothetical protein
MERFWGTKGNDWAKPVVATVASAKVKPNNSDFLFMYSPLCGQR